jgi:transposase-like protein
MTTREIAHQYRLSQWTEIIRECRGSGQTVKRWCKEHDVSDKSYYYWLRKVREAACNTLPQTGGNSQIMVPVNTTSELAKDVQTEINNLPYDLRIHFGSCTIDISNNASTGLIENTLKVIKNVG